MICPGPEQAAAYADGRLDAADSALYLEHCSECDDCRRTLAFLSIPREASGMPRDVEARVLGSVRRALGGDRERGATRPIRRIAPPRPQASPVGFVIAAALLAGFVALVLMAKQPPARVAEPREIVQKDPEVPPAPPREIPAPPAPEIPRQEPAPKQEVAELPKPLPPRVEEPKIVPVPEFFAREAPKIDETRVEEPPKAPAHTVAARSLSELQLTDISGPLTVHRKGAKTKERLSGVARIGEGDIVSAEKTASFRVDGRHPMVLSENTTVSMAFVAQEQAPWVLLHSGEALVDSTGSARWVVTDGRVAVAVKPARARFTAARGDTRLALASLSEPLYVQPDGGQVHAIHPGEELQVGKSSAEVRPLDAALAAKKRAAFDAARPRQQTIFYTSCDPADAKREHFFVREGYWLKNEGLMSRERGDRTSAATVGPNPRYGWRETQVLRVRFMTNCRSVEIQQRVDDKKYTMFKAIPVERKGIEQWVSMELPFSVAAWAFRRDDGHNQLVVNSTDQVDSVRFVVKGSDVFGDQKPYVLVDDIQVFEKD